MRGFVLVVALAGALAGCGKADKQWYKPGAEYTVAEFQRDRTACEKSGKLDEGCLKQRGWVPLSQDPDKPIPLAPSSRGRYY